MRITILFVILFLLLSVFFSLDLDAYATSSKKHNSAFNHEDKDSRIQVNKYANYIHFQPQWESYPKNLLFDVTSVWNKVVNEQQIIEEENLKRGAKTNVNTLQYLEEKPYLEVQYDYIDCNYQWIHYARSGSDVLGSKLEYITGKQLEPDHNSALFSHIPIGDKINRESNLNYYSQFIPICTSKETTSFDYGVRIDDKTTGFDVYFVPSIDERQDYHNNPEDFWFYPNCLGLGYQSYSGTCNNVDKNSGLLIIIPDDLNKPLTKISIKLKEQISEK